MPSLLLHYEASRIASSNPDPPPPQTAPNVSNSAGLWRWCCFVVLPPATTRNKSLIRLHSFIQASRPDWHLLSIGVAGSDHAVCRQFPTSMHALLMCEGNIWTYLMFSVSTHAIDSKEFWTRTTPPSTLHSSPRYTCLYPSYVVEQQVMI